MVKEGRNPKQNLETDNRAILLAGMVPSSQSAEFHI